MGSTGSYLEIGDIDFFPKCPVCYREVYCKYSWNTDIGAFDARIVEQDCDCLLGQEWVEDALEDYLS